MIVRYLLTVVPGVLAALAAVAVPITAYAQGLTATECATVADSLAAGAAMTHWHQIVHCPSQLAPAVAEALQTTRTSTDSVQHNYLRWIASWARTPTIGRAAMDVVHDTSATLAARVSSELILITQYMAGAVYNMAVNWNDMLALDLDAPCDFGYAHGVDWDETIAEEYRDSLVAHFRFVRRDPRYPTAVRNLADCADGVIVGDDVPPFVDPAWISAEYVCGNKFVIRNSDIESVHLSYAIGSGDSEAGEMGIPPNGEQLFFADSPGTLTLRAGDAVIAVVENGGLACLQESLASQLKSPAWRVRSSAAEAIGEIPAAEIRPDLRRALIATLEREGQLHDEVRRGVRPHLENPELVARLAALVAPLQDSTAIPGLLGALGMSPAAVFALADFGEMVIPALAAQTSSESVGVAMDALLALRLIAEDPGADQLSSSARAMLLSTARHHLNTSRSPVILMRAIDLGIALSDPDLRAMVEQLARDRSVLVARGITDADHIERVQDQAAARLRAVPPLPREPRNR